MKIKRKSVLFNSGIKKQRGIATLMITMIMMFAVTLLTVQSSRFGLLELFISQNYESRVTAFNSAESGMDALYSVFDSVAGKTVTKGYTYCTGYDSKLTVNCDENSISTWPSDLANVKNQAQITYEGIVSIRAKAASSAEIDFASYTLRSMYDDLAAKGSKTETVMGVVQLNL